MKNNTQKPRKIPERRCTGCGGTFPKKDLVRVVRSPEGEVSLDFTGKKSGRGAYICRSTECFRMARKARRFEKAFSCMISDELYDGMERELENEE